VSGARLRVTLRAGLPGQLRSIRASVHGLGLRRIRDSRVVEDTPAVRGMIRRAQHLLVVEPV